MHCANEHLERSRVEKPSSDTPSRRIHMEVTMPHPPDIRRQFPWRCEHRSYGRRGSWDVSQGVFGPKDLFKVQPSSKGSRAVEDVDRIRNLKAAILFHANYEKFPDHCL
ncbi:hypothetical protein AJ78_03614 [Emergomyces pasteurianus Ep9510]|uniref:Uncharacterized protein n=1 Tax=Emergomyces pasteurianus Ep9510 TaxID=1447872 RepID=A0A1J9PJG7_9EURO|nr:hypothetical protein AJ78_03614 [Emergomyces pasteurianus Ep9510]